MATQTMTATDRKITFSAGAVAGIIAGLGMALLAMILSAVRGEGFFFPVYLIGATFVGVRAILGGLTPLVAGLLLHLAVSAGLGVLFSFLIRKETTALAAFWSGIIYAIAVWLVMTGGVVPLVNSTLSARIPLMRGSFFAEHLVYGGLLFLIPLLRHEMAQRVHQEEDVYLKKVG